jgi:hypothetical protein
LTVRATLAASFTVTLMRLLLATGLVALPLSASAYAPTPPARPSAPSGVTVTGEASVRDARVSIRCDALVLTETFATCRVEASYEVVTRAGATVAPAAASPDTVRFNGAAAAARTLPPGGSLRVTVSATRSLATSTRYRGGPWVISPAAVRHPFLGESADLDHQGDSTGVVLYVGERVALEGTIALDHVVEPAVHVAAGESVSTYDPRPDAPSYPRTAEQDADAPRVTVRYASVALSVSARDDTTGPLQNGGPVFAFGLRGPVDQELTRGVYRVGWEVSLFEYGFVQAAMEMDGESLFESLVVDVATPEIAIMIPSLRLGAGVVARQLGPRPADFALRLRVGASLLPMGFDADFDYWPEVSGWTLSFTGRISP